MKAKILPILCLAFVLIGCATPAAPERPGSATRRPTATPRPGATLTPTPTTTLTAIPKVVQTRDRFQQKLSTAVAKEAVVEAATPRPTVRTSKGDVLTIPGTAFVDGRDPQARPARTTMNVPLRSRAGVNQGRITCRLAHGKEVQVLEFERLAQGQGLYFRVQASNCRGWLSEQFLSAEQHAPVGDRVR